MQNEANHPKITIPQVSLPKGGGALKGIGETFRPNSFSGTGSLTIPIYTSPCRNFEPKLTLDYNSAFGNGPFGLGFSLSVPNISRKTEKKLPQYNNSDIFVLSNAEDLVAVKSSKSGDGKYDIVYYQPRVESNFAKIEYLKSSDESYWRITTKDNIISVYGKSENSRVFDPNNKSNIFQWLLEETYDSKGAKRVNKEGRMEQKGNRIKYTYNVENTDNVPYEVYEQNRNHTANKYIQSIRYGNMMNSSEDDLWTFEVIFDYGEYDVDDNSLKEKNCDPYLPTKKWPARDDSFSTYKSGFEIRTHRLCRNILMFHHLPDKLGNKPCLVRKTCFYYNESMPMRLLETVYSTGCRRNEDGSYELKSLPPLEFGYSPFIPEKQEFNVLKVDNKGVLPGHIEQSEYNLIDLYGEGIPGFLSSNNKTALYWKPKGNGEYELPKVPEQFPIESDLSLAQYSLVSLEGNGKLDLVVGTVQRGGFYQCNPDGTWEPYLDFKSYPLDYVDPRKNMVDIDGDGIPDIMIFEGEGSRIYTSLKKEGYSLPIRTVLEKDFPDTVNRSKEEIVAFSDFLGDGLSHRIRIRNGSVECWPHLGYGKFGEKFLMGDAPNFGEAFDSSRLYLADVDGSGTVDIIYFCFDHVKVYFNQNGNKFSSQPLCISLPEALSSVDQISFGDVNGNGASCLIFSKMTPSVKHYYYEFTGGNKPYLMTMINNNLGAITNIYYKSSVKYYLEDQKSGRPWKNKIPFPVQVVEKSESIDQISGLKLTASYTYHDGYYDYKEKEFRGFAFVEEWDTEDFQSYNRQGMPENANFNVISDEFFVPPVHTKRWYHTGDIRDTDGISKCYKELYYNQDEAAYIMPDNSFDDDIVSGDSETLRQAYRALKGQMLREEIYALDNKAGISEHPYSITEANFHVRLLHEGNNNQLPVFAVYEKENVNSRYERNPKDPRIEHDFTLEVGAHGEITKSCRVYYPRRLPEYPEQAQLKVVATQATYIENDNGFYFHSMPCENKSFEINGVELEQGQAYLSYEDVKKQVLKIALNNEILYGDNFTEGQKQARLVGWNCDYFWNEEQNNCMPLGQITSKALLHHSETAVFNAEFIKKISSNKLTNDDLTDYGGYVLKGKYWWNQGLVSHYYKPEENKFCLPCKVERSLALTSSPLYQKTEMDYDSYMLAVTSLKQYVTEDRLNETGAELDYTTLQLCQIKDINNNTAQAIYDPLGMVIATSVFGTVNGKRSGDMDLKEYCRALNTTFDSVLDSIKGSMAKKSNPYLQQATAYFYYDMLAFMEKKKPACFINLIRETNVSELDNGMEGKIHVHISYTDGFGRELEKKVKADTGEAIAIDKSTNKAAVENSEERWIASGRTVYNNKGKPVMKYPPYFIASAYYEKNGHWELIEQLLPAPSIVHYDPLLREIRMDIPKGSINGPEMLGFFTKVEFNPWEEKHYDQNDTIKDSKYYKAFHEYMKNNPNPAQKEIDEKDGLDKAACFYQTPEIKVFDNMGLAFMMIQNNMGEVFPGVFNEIVSKTSGTSDELWIELENKGFIEYNDLSQGSFVASQFKPYDSGFSLNLSDKFNKVEEEIIKLLKQSCLITYSKFDITGRTIVSIDPRLYYSNASQKTQYYNFKYYYAMNGKDPILNDSVDAGSQFHLNNIFDKLYWSWTARNFNQQIFYDWLQRPVKIQMKGIKEDGTIAADNTVEVLAYGETLTGADDKNLRGQLYEHKDQAGIIRNSLFGIGGELLETSRQITRDYKEAINWKDSVPMEEEVFKSRFVYNALRSIILEITPDGSETSKTYNQTGQLDSISVKYSDGSKQNIVDYIEYEANGHRKIMSYANGTTVKYSYDPVTLQLIGLNSSRDGEYSKGGYRNTILQNINYTYDPVGNITRIRDKSFQNVFNGNQKIEPLMDYTYDALYRLIRANGRKHKGVKSTSHINNKKDSFKQSCFIVTPNDTNNLENYSERYSYDEAGNLVETKHTATNGWTRTMEIMPDSDRLKNMKTGDEVITQEFSYDRSGNQKQIYLNSSVELTWGCCENLIRASVIKRPDEDDDCDYYTYDNEMRIRKVSERFVNTTVVRKEEKMYIGNYEIKRIKNVDENGNEKMLLDRQTLRIMDDKTCVAINHYWIQDDQKIEVDEAGIKSLHYQMDNHLKSVSMELDNNARLISYEEYFPYGGTAIIAGNSQKEVGLKEYRYSGKECDDSTGLYYYGARFYVPWLGRWLKPDPAGTVDGLNLYVHVGENPVSFSDMKGMMKANVEGLQNYYMAEIIPGSLEYNHGLIEAAQAQIRNPGTIRNVLEGWFEGKLTDANFNATVARLSEKINVLAEKYNEGRNRDYSWGPWGLGGKISYAWDLVKGLFTNLEREETFYSVEKQKGKDESYEAMSVIGALGENGPIAVNKCYWDTIMGKNQGLLKLHASHVILHEQFHKYTGARDMSYIDSQSENSQVTYRKANERDTVIQIDSSSQLPPLLDNADTLAGIVVQLGMIGKGENYENYRKNFYDNTGDMWSILARLRQSGRGLVQSFVSLFSNW